MNHPISIGRGSRLLSLYSYYSLILALSIVVVDGLGSAFALGLQVLKTVYISVGLVV